MSFKSPKSHSPSPPAGPTRKTSPLAVQSSLPAPVAPAAQAFAAGAAVSSQSSAVSLSAGSVISDSGSDSTRGSVNVKAVAKPAAKAATAAGPTESGKSTIVSRWKRAGLSLGFVPDAMPKPLKSSPRLIAQWRGQSDMILYVDCFNLPVNYRMMILSGYSSGRWKSFKSRCASSPPLWTPPPKCGPSL